MKFKVIAVSCWVDGTYDHLITETTDMDEAKRYAEFLAEKDKRRANPNGYYDYVAIVPVGELCRHGAPKDGSLNSCILCTPKGGY